jgi:hypothetical protein
MSEEKNEMYSIKICTTAENEARLRCLEHYCDKLIITKPEIPDMYLYLFTPQQIADFNNKNLDTIHMEFIFTKIDETFEEFKKELEAHYFSFHPKSFRCNGFGWGKCASYSTSTNLTPSW